MTTNRIFKWVFSSSSSLFLSLVFRLPFFLVYFIFGLVWFSFRSKKIIIIYNIIHWALFLGSLWISNTFGFVSFDSIDLCFYVCVFVHMIKKKYVCVKALGFFQVCLWQKIKLEFNDFNCFKQPTMCVWTHVKSLHKTTPTKKSEI